jgi:hypothetical protein
MERVGDFLLSKCIVADGISIFCEDKNTLFNLGGACPQLLEMTVMFNRSIISFQFIPLSFFFGLTFG